MKQTKISFRNEFILVVAPDRNFCSRTESALTFHKYRVKEVRVHSGMELGTWIGWADQLTHSRTFHNYHVKKVRVHSGTELGTWIGWANQLTRQTRTQSLLGGGREVTQRILGSFDCTFILQ